MPVIGPPGTESLAHHYTIQTIQISVQQVIDGGNSFRSDWIFIVDLTLEVTATATGEFIQENLELLSNKVGIPLLAVFSLFD